MIKIINDLFKRFITGLSGDIVDTSDESLGKDSPNHDGQVSETEYAGLEPNFSLDTLKDSKRLLNYILCIRFFSGMHSIVSASQFPYTNLSQGCH